MKLIDDFRAELNRLWSIRIAIFGVFVALGDTMLSAFGDRLPPWIYAVVSVVLIVSRLVKQA